jgi:hypothetical protein
MASVQRVRSKTLGGKRVREAALEKIFLFASEASGLTMNCTAKIQ